MNTFINMRKPVYIIAIILTTFIFFACKKENTMRHKLNGVWNIIKLERYSPKGTLIKTWENCGYVMLYDQGKKIGYDNDTSTATNDCINRFTIDSVSSWALTNRLCVGNCYWFATSKSRMYFWSSGGYSQPVTLWWDIFQKGSNKYEWHHEGTNYEEVFTVVRSDH